jgi:hypothetical protein
MELYEFIKEKIEEHHDDVVEHFSQYTAFDVNGGLQSSPHIPEGTMPPNVIEKIKDELLKRPEFKGVKKINVLESPVYFADIHTGDPLTKFQLEERKDAKGNIEDAKHIHTPSLLIKGDSAHTRDIDDLYWHPLDENHETFFSEEVDIYMISLTPKMYDPEVLNKHSRRSGVWLKPKMYNPDTFVPHRRIEIVWNDEDVEDRIRLGQLNEDEYLEEVLNQVRDLWNSRKQIETNVPGAELRNLIFRLSPRSIVKKEENEPAK